MLPELFSIGPFHLSALGVFLVLALFVTVYRVWKNARDHGIDDDKIFDNLIVVILSALLGARIFFAIFHTEMFSENWLRLFLVWKIPGLSWIGALLGGLASFLIYTTRQKVPAAVIFDSYGVSLPWMLVFISTGIFLDGGLIGKETQAIWGLPVPGVLGNRHPVALYALVGAVFMLLFLVLFRYLTQHKKVPPGTLGWGMISCLGLLQLILAFFRADLLYFDQVSLDHFISLVLILAPLGPVFVLLNGPTHTKALIKRIHKKGNI